MMISSSQVWHWPSAKNYVSDQNLVAHLIGVFSFFFCCLNQGLLKLGQKMIQKIFKKYQNQKSDEICTLCYKLCWHFPLNSKIAISDKFTENYENLKNRKFWTPFWNKVPFKNYVISKSAFFYPLLPPWDDIVYGRPLRMKKITKDALFVKFTSMILLQW